MWAILAKLGVALAPTVIDKVLDSRTPPPTPGAIKQERQDSRNITLGSIGTMLATAGGLILLYKNGVTDLSVYWTQIGIFGGAALALWANLRPVKGV